MSDDGGRFQRWTTVPASDPTAVVTGMAGHTDAFKTVAHDFADNVEPMPRKL